MYNSIMYVINCVEALERLALGRLGRIESVINDNEKTDEMKIESLKGLVDVQKLYDTDSLIFDSEFNIAELRSMIEMLNEKGSL